MIYIAADHAGFELKEELRHHLEERGEEVTDLGPATYTPGDDYPDYALAVAARVAAGEGTGLLVCDTGIGDSIAANKVSGIRAALVTSEFAARRCREHNDANILVLGSELTSPYDAKKFLELFLDTAFSGDERHVRRLAKITEAEGVKG